MPELITRDLSSLTKRGTSMKVALVHDFLLQMGGGEKVLEALHELFPAAPIYTSAYDPDAMPAYYRTWNIQTSFLQRLPLKSKLHRLVLPLYPAAFESFDLSGYDLVISSSSAFAKGVITQPHTTHICYTHTPMRYAWASRAYMENEKASRLARALVMPQLHYLRQWDVVSASRPDIYVANSSTVAGRIRKFYRRDATVVFPPVDTTRFQMAERVEDYYIIVSRFVPYKRIDLAIDAFTRLGLPLKVVGSGRQRAALEARAGDNITFMGRVDDVELPQLVARARGYVMPGEEDFGIAPVEAMAAGVPVIAFASGGALDTQIDGQTGVLFDEPNVDGLCQAIQRFEKITFDRAAIRNHARCFDQQAFVDGITKVVFEALGSDDWQNKAMVRVRGASSLNSEDMPEESVTGIVGGLDAEHIAQEADAYANVADVPDPLLTGTALTPAMPEPASESAIENGAERAEVHQRARRGILLMMGRQGVLQVLTFGGGIILARALNPAEFGLYAIATFLVNTLAHFGDFGLAPSLIQRKAELNERDLQVGFTLQQMITGSIVVFLLIAAPWLAALYPKAPPDTVWLVRALAFTLFLTSWRTMSALQLERHLRYDRLAGVEVAEVLVFQSLAVGLALAHWSVWSFVVASLARGFVGTLLTYTAAPWPIRLRFDRKQARDILRFGIPFQFQGMATQVGGWITPLFVGRMIGPAAVGYLNWASSNGKKPLMLAESVMRVAFPHFARIQDDLDEVERIMTRYLTVLLLVSGAWFALLAVAGPSLVHWIYTDKWTRAVPALILSGAALALDVVSMVLCITLNGIGQVKITTQVVLMRNIGSVVFSVPLVLLIGFNGVPVSYLIASIIAVPWVFRGLKAGALIRVMRPLVWILLPVVGSIVIGKVGEQVPVALWLHAVGGSILTMSLYGLVAMLVAPDWIKQMARKWLSRVISYRIVRPQQAGA